MPKRGRYISSDNLLPILNLSSIPSAHRVVISFDCVRSIAMLPDLSSLDAHVLVRPLQYIHLHLNHAQCAAMCKVWNQQMCKRVQKCRLCAATHKCTHVVHTPVKCNLLFWLQAAKGERNVCVRVVYLHRVCIQLKLNWIKIYAFWSYYLGISNNIYCFCV